MKYIYLFFSTVLFLFTSCSGILWEGVGKGDLTISIKNPYYTGTSSSSASKALALQGQYLYIELAQIDDQAAYNADTGKALSGNGNWVDTSWGGHAIVTLSLTDLLSSASTIDATFNDVPRGVDLKARAILDTDKATFLDAMSPQSSNYGYYVEVPPICSTYNASAPDIFDTVGSGADIYDQWWIDIPSSELDSNLLTLPMRPKYPNSVSWGTSTFLTEDFTQTPTNVYPTSGETTFYYLNPDLTLGGVRDVAYYCLVYNSALSIISTPSIFTFMYDNDGNPIGSGSATYTSNLPTSATYTYRLLQTYKASLSDTTSPDYFFGITSSITIPSVDSWNLSYGLLYDTGASVINYTASWTLPTGVYDTDLDFRILQTTSTSLATSDLDTLSKIYAQPMSFDSGWIAGTGSTYYDGTSTLGSVSSQYIIILAKTAGSSADNAFIFALFKY